MRKKSFEDEEGFKKVVIIKENYEEFPDEIIDCWEHLEELKISKPKGRIGKKKLKYYKEKMKNYEI
jgi:hypothetical protein